MHSLPQRYAEAATRTWIAGNGIWTDNAGASNWNPADEPDPDDAAFFVTLVDVTMGSDNHVDDLRLDGRAWLRTNGRSLTVNDFILVDAMGNDATLYVDQGAGAVTQASRALFRNDATLNMMGGIMTVTDRLDIGDTDSRLIGSGLIQLTGARGFVNDGLIRPDKGSLLHHRCGRHAESHQS